jgi:phosphatidate cytidylyltransferase
MLRWRLLLGTLIVAAIAGLCWLDARSPGAGLLPLAIVLTLLGTAEVLYLARAGGIRPLAWPVYCGNLLIVAGCYGSEMARLLAAYHHWPSSQYLGALPALVVALLVVLAAEMARYEKPGGTFANLGVSVFALCYVGLMFSFAVNLRLNWGIAALASWIIPVKMGDIGAYTVGRIIGRHKMAPRISPGKTWEGAVGALVFAAFGSYATFAWLLPHLGWPSLNGYAWLPFGLLLGGVGILGDLAESLLKRDVGCKDSSTWLPGFGGVLDILDSLLLTAPVAWAWWALAMQRW